MDDMTVTEIPIVDLPEHDHHLERACPVCNETVVVLFDADDLQIGFFNLDGGRHGCKTFKRPDELQATDGLTDSRESATV